MLNLFKCLLLTIQLNEYWGKKSSVFTSITENYYFNIDRYFSLKYISKILSSRRDVLDRQSTMSKQVEWFASRYISLINGLGAKFRDLLKLISSTQTFNNKFDRNLPILTGHISRRLIIHLSVLDC